MRKKTESLIDRVAGSAGTLPAALQSVAQFIAQHPDVASASSAAELGVVTGTSDATVVRTAKALGYAGVKDMRRAAAEVLATRANPGAVLANRIERMHESVPLAQLYSDTVASLGAVVEQLPQDHWAAVVERVGASSGVLCYGLPPVGFIAEYLGLMLNRIGVPARAETTTGPYLADRLLSLPEIDTVVVFAPVRPFRELGAVFRRADELEARKVLITEAIGMPLSAQADHVLVTPATSLNTAGEVTVPLFLAHALVLSVAATREERSVETMHRLDAIRRTIID